MKNYNKILEAVNRGLQLALDDFDDEQVQNIKSKQVYNRDFTKEYLDLLKYKVVDLGLPSGTLWCKYNLGATCKPNNNESWIGDYYSWGELEPNKKKYDWRYYKFYNGPDTNADVFTERYITKYGLNDPELTELQPEDDAAYQNMHFYNFKFHIPTVEQAQELLNNTKVIYIQNVSKNPEYENAKGYTGSGWFFISKINGNYLFFPETGIKNEEGLEIYSKDSGIWTTQTMGSSISTKAICAAGIKFSPFNPFNQHLNSPKIFGFYKYRGLPIRPVVNL